MLPGKTMANVYRSCDQSPSGYPAVTARVVVECNTRMFAVSLLITALRVLVFSWAIQN